MNLEPVDMMCFRGPHDGGTLSAIRLPFARVEFCNGPQSYRVDFYRVVERYRVIETGVVGWGLVHVGHEKKEMAMEH